MTDDKDPDGWPLPTPRARARRQSRANELLQEMFGDPVVPPDNFKRLWDLTEPPKKKRKRRKRKQKEHRTPKQAARERYKAAHARRLERWAKDIADLHKWTP